MFEFRDKKILVFGLKNSGYHVTRLLNKHQITVDLADQQIAENELDSDMSKNRYIAYECLLNTISTYDMVIKSPGIPDDHELIKRALKHQILIVSEIEVAYSFFNKQKTLIGVTGTNGKTTTTSLITEVLKQAGHRAISCGNIGFTFSEAVYGDCYDYYVCELSSFQLGNIYDFKPDVAVILNITPNHIEYHKSFNNYLWSKLKILSNMAEDDVLIYNGDDQTISNSIKRQKMHKQAFSVTSIDTACSFRPPYIYYNNIKLIDTTKVHLLGIENFTNIMAAILACKAVNIANKAIKKAVYGFKPLDYRMQFIGESDGVRFYNDAKSTNVSATQCAVAALGERIILILGGVSKESDYKPLMSDEKIKYIIAYGENKESIKNQADEHKKVCFLCMNLLEVMKLVKKIMREGDAVLLSPAAQSFDQYDNYVKRGEDFNSLFHTVIKF